MKQSHIKWLVHFLKNYNWVLQYSGKNNIFQYFLKIILKLNFHRGIIAFCFCFLSVCLCCCCSAYTFKNRWITYVILEHFLKSFKLWLCVLTSGSGPLKADGGWSFYLSNHQQEDQLQSGTSHLQTVDKKNCGFFQSYIIFSSKIKQNKIWLDPTSLKFVVKHCFCIDNYSILVPYVKSVIRKSTFLLKECFCQVVVSGWRMGLTLSF